MAKKTTKKRAKRNPVGRPQTVFTAAQIVKMSKLALNGCQNGTIASIMDIPKNTLLDNCRLLLSKKRAERKNKLRTLQMTAARKGNPALLIFLGKNELEQADKHDIEHDVSDGLKDLMKEIGGKGDGLPIKMV